jgi:hypothetical protein
MKYRPLALLVALVLLCHWAGLTWLGEQALLGKPMVLMPDPLFTRMITPASVPAPAPKARAPAPRLKQVAVADAAPADAATPPDAAATMAATEPAPPPAEAAPPAPDASAPGAPALEAAAPVPLDAGAPIDSWPADTRLSYQLKGYYRGNVWGSARVQWQRQQSRYQVRLDMSLALVLRLSMTSQGLAGDGGLVPSDYEERFLWGVRRMTFEGGYVQSLDGRSVSHERTPPQALQDTASQFVELSHRFASGRAKLAVGSQVRFWLARPQGTSLWTYDVVAEETLQTPELGPVQAFHLRPQPIANPAGEITAEIWFAPSLQYLPVRVRIALGGDNFIDLMVERIEQGAPPVLAAPEPMNP